MGFLDGLFDSAKGERESARNILNQVRVPTQDDLALQLEQLVQQGQLTPEQAATVQQGPSAYQTIETDPRLRQAQMDSLAQYQTIAGAGGMDAIGKATLEDALSQQRSTSRGAQDAIMANARARGQGGSGLEYVNRLIAAQGAAAQGSRAALDAGAAAQTRRDYALTQGANLAGNMQNSDFNQAAQKAAAADRISQLNAAMSQGQINLNTNARNQAQATNLGARQSIADQNTGIRNENASYKAQLPITAYNLARGNAIDRAGQQLQEGQGQQAATGKMLNTVQSIGSLFAGAYGGGAAGAAAAASSNANNGSTSSAPSQDYLERQRRLLEADSYYG